MTLVWVVPMMVLLFGGVALAALCRSAAGSARELGEEIVRFGELHVALARVRTEIQRGR